MELISAISGILLLIATLLEMKDENTDSYFVMLRRILWVGSVALLIISFYIAYQSRNISVPNVENCDRKTAIAILSEAGLYAEIIIDFNRDIGYGYIFDQFPEAGTKVRRGSAIKTYVSKGPSLFSCDIDFEDKYEVEIGNTMEIDVSSISSSDGGEININYKSDDPNIAYVDDNGIVTGRTIGNTKVYIKATNPKCYDLERTIYIRVVDPDESLHDKANNSLLFIKNHIYSNNSYKVLLEFLVLSLLDNGIPVDNEQDIRAFTKDRSYFVGIHGCDTVDEIITKMNKELKGKYSADDIVTIGIDHTLGEINATVWKKNDKDKKK